MAKKRARVGADERLLEKVRKTARFRGKHVVLIHGRVYGATSGSDLQRLIETARKQFPQDTPTLIYVPRADALILVVACRR
jgi:hypothetical protein